MAESLTVARRLKAGSGRKTRSSRSRTSMPDPDPEFAVFRGTAHPLSGLSSQGRTIAKGIPECQTQRAILWYDRAPEVGDFPAGGADVAVLNYLISRSLPIVP